MLTLYITRRVYKREDGEFVLFWAQFWKFEAVGHLSLSSSEQNAAVGFFYAPGTGSGFPCPGMVTHGGWYDYNGNDHPDDKIVVAECPTEGVKIEYPYS